jgi:primosomal protein N' (replication factor Y)
LVLVPEIGLTPQLVQRFADRLGVEPAVLHSGLSDRERLQAWLTARDGRASIVIGTRSAVFTPMLNPGVVIIDEEHDLSFKQQEGFRYHARDVAVWRARQLGIPIVLGSATPSFETLYNAERGRYQRLALPARAGDAKAPRLRSVDMRHQKLTGNLSPILLQAIGRHLEQGNQVLLFLNRRGYSPTVLCHDCGWVAQCRRCDARLIYHRGRRRLSCHHCGAEQAMAERCPACGGAELRPLGHGTERVEQTLREHFPQYSCARIDRDSTRRKGALQQLLADAHNGRHRILLGTQMLAKGHHLPNITLAAILDGDQGLFGADFRAGERMAQLITQVAGRAGRAAQAGEVLIQTHHPDHPLLRTLLTEGYHRYAAAALAERREAELPPYVNLALLRAEAAAAEAPNRFLNDAATLGRELRISGVSLLGPAPSPMERRAGRYRAQLLAQAAQRADLHRLLDAWLPSLAQLPSARKVRWSIDVDPMEMV